MKAPRRSCTKSPRRPTAPSRYLTGFLKRTRYIRRLGFGKFGRYRLGYSAFYARYVHDGTSKQAAQPWLQRAIDKVRGRASRIAAKAIRVKLRQASSPRAKAPRPVGGRIRP